MCLFIFSCSDKEEEKMKTKIKDSDSLKYHIEYTSYWENNNERIRPFIIVKVDTINHFGSSIRYTEQGRLFERIVILDKNYAIKLDYDNDTITKSVICTYMIRKDHPTKSIYSIVVGK